MSIKNIFKKYLTQKVRNIISIFIIIFGLVYIINYSFYRPTYINKYIAMNIYREPANNAFADQKFYNCIINNYNSQNNVDLAYTDEISDEQLTSMTKLQCKGWAISDVSGIDKLSNLTDLNLFNNNIKRIDLSGNTDIVFLDLSKNNLTSVILGDNTNLEELVLSGNNLSSLDVSKNTKLTYLNLGNRCYVLGTYCGSNNLTNIDLSKNILLKELYVYGNNLSNIDLSNNTLLEIVDGSNNELESIDLTSLVSLKELYINHNNIDEINLSRNTELVRASLLDNQLSNIDVSNNHNLVDLSVAKNSLRELDLDSNTKLKRLFVSGNNLERLKLYNNSELEELEIGRYETGLTVNNGMETAFASSSGNDIGEIDLSNNEEIRKLFLTNNRIRELNLSKNLKLEYLYVENNGLKTLDVSKNINLKQLYASNNRLTSLNIGTNNNLQFLHVGEYCYTDLESLICLDGINHNKLTSIDVSNNPSLIYLDASSNELERLDLSNNTNLTTLKLTGNSFGGLITKYSGEVENVSNIVTLPGNLDNSILWESKDERVATIDENGNLKALRNGTTNIIGTNEYYTINLVVNVIGMTSEINAVDEEEKIIYVKNEKDIDTIKNSVSYGDLNLNVDLTNNKLEVIENDEVKTTFKIIRIDSDDYKIGDDYIYVGTDDNINKLTCYNCTSEVKDDKVIIKYNDKEIDRIKFVKVTLRYSSNYPDEKTIFIGTDGTEEVQNNIEVTNGEVIIDNLKAKILYNDILLDEFGLLGFSTSYKKISDKTLYTGFEEFDADKVVYNGDITGIYNNNKFTIYNGDDVIEIYNVITLDTNDIEVSKRIMRTSVVDYNEFINNLSNIDNISYKVIYNNEEITGGDINPDSILNVYYNDQLIDKYYINPLNTFKLDEDIKVKDNSIIYDIIPGNTRDNLLDKVITGGEISILDKDNNAVLENIKLKTGYIFRTIFENDLNNPLDYRLSVKGDVLGTGELSRANAKEIARHIIDKNVLNGEEYLLAADYNNDGKIKMNDVVKILKDKKKQENP